MARFTEQRFRLTLDTYLSRLHGFGPLRTKRQRDREFAGLLGYNRDPAWQLPALRALLPVHQSIINNQGEVEFDGIAVGEIFQAARGARINGEPGS
jgi:hypothetical protein